MAQWIRPVLKAGQWNEKMIFLGGSLAQNSLSLLTHGPQIVHKSAPLKQFDVSLACQSTGFVPYSFSPPSMIQTFWSHSLFWFSKPPLPLDSLKKQAAVCNALVCLCQEKKLAFFFCCCSLFRFNASDMFGFILLSSINCVPVVKSLVVEKESLWGN